MEVPKDFLINFLNEATAGVNNLKSLSDYKSLSEIRSLLLETQTNILQHLVEQHNSSSASMSVNAVQNALGSLKDPSLVQLAEKLNDEARLAYARLALCAGVIKDAGDGLRERMALKASGELDRVEILEFCGLCSAIMRLPNVQSYLACGSKLFPDHPNPSEQSALPPKRVERLQQIVFNIIGYDPDYGKLEMQRLFFSSETSQYSNDEEVLSAVQSMMLEIHDSISKASSTNAQKLSDVDEGGFTRVVAVEYSEKEVDAQGQVIENPQETAPSNEAMEEQAERQQKASLEVAYQAARLQNEVLNELRSMSEAQRNQHLAKAKQVSDNFVLEVTQRAPGPERIEFLRSIDPETQKLMLMHKLWEGMKASQELKG